MHAQQWPQLTLWGALQLGRQNYEGMRRWVKAILERGCDLGKATLFSQRDSPKRLTVEAAWPALPAPGGMDPLSLKGTLGYSTVTTVTPR